MATLNLPTFSTFFCNPRTLNSRKFPSKQSKKPPFTRFHRIPSSLSPNFHSSNAVKFRTLAQFGGPTNRRNSLRKKLLRDHHHQVRLNDPPPSKFNNPVLGNGLDDSVFEGTKVENFGVGEREKPELSLGESVLLDKLENWVQQCKREFEYWGIGSAPIFTVYEDSNGGVRRVLVDEDEILRRSRVERQVIKNFPEVSNKILNAKNMAREMENGNNVIARNSSVAKFVVQGEDEKEEEEEGGGFVKAVRGFVAQPGLLPKISVVGSKVLCVLVVLWAVKKLFTFGDKEAEHTEIEKEMMRRKIKARKEREMLVKGAIEIIPESSESLMVDIKKPELDKDQLRSNILKAKGSADKIVVQGLSAKVKNRTMEMDYKVQEIQEMARWARRIEGRDKSPVSRDAEMDEPVINESSNKMDVIQKNSKPDQSLSKRGDEVERKTTDSNAILETKSIDVTENIDNSFLDKVVLVDECNLRSSNVTIPGDLEVDEQKLECIENTTNLKDREGMLPLATPINGSSRNGSVKKKPRIIRSVQEARDYLSKRNDKQEPDTESKFGCMKENIDLRLSSDTYIGDQNGQISEKNKIVSRIDAVNKKSDSKPAVNSSGDSNQNDKEFGTTINGNFKDSDVKLEIRDLQKSETTLDSSKVKGTSAKTGLPLKAENWLEKNFNEVEPIVNQVRKDSLNGISDSKNATDASEGSNQVDKEFCPAGGYVKDSGIETGVGEFQNETTLEHEVSGVRTERQLSGRTENWLEKNFHEVEPIIKQIGGGFRDNYMAARERVDQPLDLPTEMESLGFAGDGGELDWMQDDHLRDIVFQVRENELSGRDPFHLMSAEDKEAFLKGLKKKVEKENKKLSHLHEWLHSNIENLDYGTDGISIYDPPEKIIPRWKGPPVEKIPEFLNEFLEQRMANSTGNSNPVKKDENEFTKGSTDSSSQEKANVSIAPIKKSKNPKTVIEGSDGSVKVGKKSGKEFWQHTKKWSQGFLDSYNAETDPEIKSTMKDIGKDLDRWITEKEIEEAADLMNKLPERNRSFVEKKMSKLKREMELFGPQAVVSKYREYADNKEEDYLWWLDLPHVLCIEMYTIDDGEERVGFYSLEMATDLELEPKPCHVIAFQDASDCKNLCYIIQAHLEMLGNGNAFVVARPPKDAFREAKANGFGVTVIKKGELQLNVDQPLEEVEEQITEIGSKIYHDMMMKERSVDVNSLMKGVFGISDSTAKRLKRRLKKHRKG